MLEDIGGSVDIGENLALGALYLAALAKVSGALDVYDNDVLTLVDFNSLAWVGASMFLGAWEHVNVTQSVTTLGFASQCAL